MAERNGDIWNAQEDGPRRSMTPTFRYLESCHKIKGMEQFYVSHRKNQTRNNKRKDKINMYWIFTMYPELSAVLQIFNIVMILFRFFSFPFQQSTQGHEVKKHAEIHTDSEW